MSKYRIDVAVAATNLTADGITTDTTEDKTSTMPTGFDDLEQAKEAAITAYGGYTAKGLPVNGTYVVDTETGDTRNPMKVVAEMTAAGFKNEPAE